MEKRGKYLDKYEAGFSQEEISGMARKSNLKEEPWKGKLNAKRGFRCRLPSDESQSKKVKIPGQPSETRGKNT